MCFHLYDVQGKAKIINSQNDDYSRGKLCLIGGIPAKIHQAVDVRYTFTLYFMHLFSPLKTMSGNPSLNASAQLSHSADTPYKWHVTCKH